MRTVDRALRLGWASAVQIVALLAASAAASVVMPSARGAETPAATERVGLRTEFSRTVENPDGTFTTSVSRDPINYFGVDGKLKPISNRLVPSSRAGYAVQNEANAFAVAFRSTLATNAVRLELKDGSAFTLGPAIARTTQGRTKGSNGFSYPSLEPGVQLEYRLLGSGVKEDVIIADPLAPASYQFLLRPQGETELSARARADGAWLFRAQNAPESLFVLAAPTVADSAGTSSPDPGGADALLAAPGKARMEVEKTREGDFVIDLHIDERWLRDPSRVFPVVLDPTITLQQAALDGYWEQSCGTCVAQTAEDKLLVGNDVGGPTAEDQTRVYVGSVIAYADSAELKGAGLQD